MKLFLALLWLLFISILSGVGMSMMAPTPVEKMTYFSLGICAPLAAMGLWMFFDWLKLHRTGVILTIVGIVIVGVALVIIFTIPPIVWMIALGVSIGGILFHLIARFLGLI